MSEDIFELLRKQEEAIRRKPTFYIHYDPSSNNRISSFRNFLDTTDSLPHLQFTQDDFDFTSPDFNIANYVIDPIERKIKKFESTVIQITTIDSYIYEIPKVKSKTRLTNADVDFDLLIEQNNPLKVFRIKLSRALRDKFLLQNVLSNEMSVYVTAINDPNILYKTLHFKFEDVINNDYHTIQFDDFAGDSANIYALRYFENYLHVDMRDE